MLWQELLMNMNMKNTKKKKIQIQVMIKLKIMDNNELTIEQLQQIIIELSSQTDSSKRRIVLGCNKLEVLEYNKCLYQKLGYDEDKINKLLERDNNELQEGIYIIDEFGVHKYGL